MAQLKLILLDFDGTLVDTRYANARAYIATLKEYGAKITEREYLDRYFGVRCMEFMRMVGFADKDTIDQIRRRKIELYPKFFDSVKLNDALWGWCQQMRKSGVSVWIVSTGHIDNITNVMRYLRIEDMVDGIISGDDVSQPKPSPECFLEAMRRANVSPEQTIIYEDSAVGLEAARGSGAIYYQVTPEWFLRG